MESLNKPPRLLQRLSRCLLRSYHMACCLRQAQRTKGHPGQQDQRDLRVNRESKAFRDQRERMAQTEQTAPTARTDLTLTLREARLLHSLLGRVLSQPYSLSHLTISAGLSAHDSEPHRPGTRPTISRVLSLQFRLLKLPSTQTQPAAQAHTPTGTFSSQASPGQVVVQAQPTS